MLDYLYIWIENLLDVVTAVTLLYVLSDRLFGQFGRRTQKIGIWAGLIGAEAFVVIRTWTNWLGENASEWNFYSAFGIVLFGLLFLVFSLIATRFFSRVHDDVGDGTVANGCAGVFGACLTAFLLFDKCRDHKNHLLLKLKLNGMGQLLDGEFLLRLVGLAAAVLLLLLYAHLLARCLRGYRKLHLPYGATLLAVAVMLARNLGLVIGCWISNSPRWLGTLVKYNSKIHRSWAWPYAMNATNSGLPVNLIMVGIAAVLMAVLFARNTRIVDAYDNPAQLRKLRATARGYRRRTVGVVVCLALSVLCVTTVKAYATRKEPPPAKGEYTVADGKVYVNVEDVNDGALHSFQYGDVRWIVIKKPNSASYGVGLDACDVCGVDKESTYFQRGTQVVCRRCDVVMNINTIGIYGGCNPVPLGYSLENGQLVFDLNEIMAGESRFTK